LSLRVFWHQVSPSNWSLGLHLYSRYDVLPKFSCVPTANPSTAYSVGAAIALPYKTTYATTTMPAPIAAALILRRARRLLLTLKRRVVGDGSDMGFPEKSLNNIQRCNCAATGTPLWERPRLSGGVPYLPQGVLFSLGCEPFRSCITVRSLNPRSISAALSWSRSWRQQRLHLRSPIDYPAA